MREISSVPFCLRKIGLIMFTMVSLISTPIFSALYDVSALLLAISAGKRQLIIKTIL